MTYEVRLEVFEGPVDLLLHLITRQKVDIYEVSIAQITEEYIAAIRTADLDLESITGFLVVAATLLELKSLRLLPGRDVDEAGTRLLEERDLLLARLVECSTFREAGAWISGRLEAGDAFHPREVLLEPQLVGLVPDPLKGTTVERLAAAGVRALTPKPVPVLDTSHVAPITASVKDAIVELAEALQKGSTLSFSELCGRAERIEVVVRFLALLELFKAGAIELDQVDRFEDIRAAWTGDVDALEVVMDAEEYSLAEALDER